MQGAEPGGPFLRLAGISKTFTGAVALSGVSLQVRAGEVIGLVGENGAGKSTLMKILGGVVAPTAGDIHVDGKRVDALTVGDAIAAGIAFVHQELSLFENLDAAANVFIGREPLYAGFLKLVDRAKLHAMARPYLEVLGADFGPHTPVAELSIAQRQILEIAKALSLDSRLLILDEPTSSLTLAETERLLKVIADLKARGVSTIFITHRLNELTACADRVVVLRDGHLVGELAKHEISHAAMIRMMIGRELKALYIPPAAPPGDGVLEIAEVQTDAHRGRAVSLTLRRGEILGLAGLIGAGRTELARVLAGVDPARGGRVTLDGQPLAVDTPRDAIARGIYLVPEDRKRCGLLLDESICENILLPDLPNNGLMVQTGRSVARAEEQKRKLGIRAASVQIQAGTLSGGNQQKVVLGKWLALNPRVLICDEPTRGVDVGAKSEIYRMLRELADAGVAILMISSDMEEVIGVSDRIAVMHEGAISGFLERADFSEQTILRLAVGDTTH